jgi:hypothetical protein
VAGIFVSYRRHDTADAAGRLFDHLARRFGKSQVFMDINGGIERGADFEVAIREALQDCAILLVLIGPGWVTCSDELGRRRLDRPEDWVRTEIATALRRSIPVFPVVLGDAPFPPGGDSLPEEIAPLARRQLSRLRTESWSHDVAELLEAVGRHVTPIPDASPPPGHAAPLVADAIERRLLARLRDTVKLIWISVVGQFEGARKDDSP